MHAQRRGVPAMDFGHLVALAITAFGFALYAGASLP